MELPTSTTNSLQLLTLVTKNPIKDAADASWLKVPLIRLPKRSSHAALTRCRSRTPTTSRMELSTTIVGGYEPQTIDTKNPTQDQQKSQIHIGLRQTTGTLVENTMQEALMMKYIKKQKQLDWKLNETKSHFNKVIKT